MKRVLLTVTVLVISMALSGFTAQQQPMKVKQQPEMRAKTLSQEKMNVAADAAKWSEAQAWLKSIGYDLTFDQMKTLKRLNLQQYSVQTQSIITDQNMRHVALLTSLEILPVHHNIGDEGLKYVADLTTLKKLILSRTKVTDNGLQYVEKLTALEQLNLDATSITDAGLEKIKHLHPGILTLNNTHITDAGISAFLTGRSVQYLALSRTDVSDAAVPALIQVKYLERLDIQGTNISEQGYQQIMAAHPSAKIYYRPSGVPNS